MLRFVVETLDRVVDNTITSTPRITESVLFSSPHFYTRAQYHAQVSESGTRAGSKKWGSLLTSRDNIKTVQMGPPNSPTEI